MLGKNYDKTPEEVEFGDQLALIIKKIINGQVPAEVQPILSDCEIFAGPKCRPIAPAIVYRKIAAIVLLQRLKDFNKNYFAGLQEALNKNGIENIIHPFRANLDINPDQDVFAMDGENAFNRCNRKQTLVTILREAPTILPYIRSFYGTSSKVWYHGLTDAIRTIDCQEGFQQGDTIATWCYSVGIQPLLMEINAIIGNNGFLKFFVDDGNIAGNFETNLKVIGHLLEHGPKYGYYISKLKGSYLLGKCESCEEAARRKQKLVGDLVQI